MEQHDDTFTPPDARKARRLRTHEALLRVTDRHARGEHRARWRDQRMPMSPADAVRAVADLAAGSVVPQEGEPAVDQDDITAALTLVPWAREEFDQMEAGLLRMAKGRGMTWQEIAFGLGLGTAQAARQRHERLSRRSDSDA
jgi:serine/threonine protein kinase HipA of HipAB toxin-antitoxin module